MGKKYGINMFVRILNKWRKTEKELFSLLNNLTLDADVKWQPLKTALILI